jgi:hypothetical protein
MYATGCAFFATFEGCPRPLQGNHALVGAAADVDGQIKGSGRTLRAAEGEGEGGDVGGVGRAPGKRSHLGIQGTRS